MDRKVVIMDHPLIQHKLSILRDVDTSTMEFRELVNEIAMLMMYDATRDLPLEDKQVTTPCGVADCKVLAGRKLAFVPILRAGLGMVDGALRLVPAARVGHIGLYRNEETLEPVEYYCKLPGDIGQRDVFVLDPMLATGGSAIDAIGQIKKRHPRSVKFLCIIAAPEGLEALKKAHPDVDIFCAGMDDHLNENGYIVPGLGLAPTAISNCQNNWWLALIALGIVIVVNVFGKGMAKIIPILIGILGAYAVAGIVGNGFGVDSFAIDFSSVKEAAWVGLPIHWSSTVFGGVHDTGKAVTAIIAIMPIALATMMEHIGDISAIGATCGKNYIANPGLHRSLAGDGLATTMSALFGGPANTTYGENTGVLALSKVYDPRVIRIAAYFAILFSFSPKFAALIDSMPAAIVGGISFVLYGMISAIGIRNVVENKVDFSKPRNTIIAAVILVCALGLGDGVSFHIGQFDINLSALAVAALAGIILNAIFPGKDYDFSKQSVADVKSTKDNKAEAKAE